MPTLAHGPHHAKRQGCFGLPQTIRRDSHGFSVFVVRRLQYRRGNLLGRIASDEHENSGRKHKDCEVGVKKCTNNYEHDGKGCVHQGLKRATRKKLPK